MSGFDLERNTQFVILFRTHTKDNIYGLMNFYENNKSDEKIQIIIKCQAKVKINKIKDKDTKKCI